MATGRSRTLALALLVTGALLVASGVFFFATTPGCQDYYISVSEGDADVPNVETVAYENLTTAQQRAFRRALQSGDATPVSGDLFEQTTNVEYRGTTYTLSLLSNDGCLPVIQTLYRLGPLLFGLALGWVGYRRYRG